ncbi:nuclear autoantigenic sperm protein-like isoform X4 [Polyodon spathula]|uniref:nuclear autoantigenic sperm protein-like isoform X4 n=1 Tax=Polyodon spathula TaxID=7913 RepID=UPI001B7E6596|nr:nuclear autoantigenic sperm protein-like isoform X4 [Polyodon spathula]
MPEESAAASSATEAESMEEGTAASSSAATADGASVDVLEEANKLIGTGNKNLVMGDIPAAVNAFQEACGMLAQKYGDTADECAEAFFLCGKSLLELARVENGVLGNALEGVPEEEDGVGEGEKKEDSKIESADNLDDGEEEEDEEEGEGEATAEDGKESEEEEVGNLQLAWEMLEIAKVIYKRKESKEDQLFAAQAHLKLGEISVESGNYPQATEDFQECLAIQKQHLEPHSRLLAETHYQLGLVFGYINQYSKAIEHFNHSVEVIESRLAMLKEVIDKAKSDESVLEDKKEMEEIKLLLPDIREKIEDAKEGQKTGKAASAAILETLSGGSTSGFSGENSGTSASMIPVKAAEVASSSKSVSDISHLIRKKRKPEEESPTKEKDAKKAKPNTSVNGSGDTATSDNGVEDKKEPAGAAMETLV